MDLDELKSQLKHKLSTDHSARSDEDIAQLLQRRTVSTVGKLKRSLLLEIWLGIPFILLCIAIAVFGSSAALRVYLGVFSVLFCIIEVFLVAIYNRTRILGEGPLPVKENLRLIVNIIDEFVKRCFQLAMIMVPVGVALIVALQFHFRETAIAPGAHNRYLTTPFRVGVFVVLYTAVFATFMYYFAKWYLHKMYGRYTAQLKQCISELDEQ